MLMKVGGRGLRSDVGRVLDERSPVAADNNTVSSGLQPARVTCPQLTTLIDRRRPPLTNRRRQLLTRLDHTHSPLDVTRGRRPLPPGLGGVRGLHKDPAATGSTDHHPPLKNVAVIIRY